MAGFCMPRAFKVQSNHFSRWWVVSATNHQQTWGKNSWTCGRTIYQLYQARLESVMESASWSSRKTWTCISLLRRCDPDLVPHQKQRRLMCALSFVRQVTRTQLSSLGSSWTMKFWSTATIRRHNRNCCSGGTRGSPRQVHRATKTMLNVYLFMYFCVSIERMMNSDFYCDVMRRLEDNVRWKIPELRYSCKWLLNHDNTPHLSQNKLLTETTWPSCHTICTLLN